MSDEFLTKRYCLLADEVSERILSLNNSSCDESNDEDYNERLRDMEAEREAEGKDGAEQEREEGRDELAVGHEEDIIDDLVHAKTGDDRDRGDIGDDLARLKKQKKERDRDAKQAIKDQKKRKDDLSANIGLLNLAKMVMKKLMAFKMHAVSTPGNQAGVFDNVHGKGSVDSKRRVEHSFDMGSQLVVDKFSTNVNGVAVTGTVSRRIDDDAFGNIVTKGKTHVDVQSVQTNGQEVASSSIGRLSPDAVMNNINRGGGFGR